MFCLSFLPLSPPSLSFSFVFFFEESLASIFFRFTKGQLLIARTTLTHRYGLWRSAISIATCCVYLADYSYVMFSERFDEPPLDFASLAFRLARNLQSQETILEERNFFLINRFQARLFHGQPPGAAAAAAAPAAPNPPRHA
jgi:hypothetical protein